MRRAGAAQIRRRHRARATKALADLEEKDWVEHLQASAADEAEQSEARRIGIQRRLVLRGRLDPQDIPEATLEHEELLPRLRRHIRTTLALEAQRRVGRDERDELEENTNRSLLYPSWTPLWIHLSWRPADKPEAAAVRAAKRPRAAAIIQKRYRYYQRRTAGMVKEPDKRLNGYMGAPDDPVSGRRLELLFYIILLIFWTLASVDSRRPDQYEQTSVVHTYLSISSDLEAPPKTFAGARARRLQTGPSDEATVDAEIEQSAPSGSGQQFDEISTREQLKQYLKHSLRRASVELAQSVSSLPFHIVTGIRVRQQRVKPQRCPSGPFDHLSSVLCYPNFHEGVEDKTAFGSNGQWEYTDGSEVQGHTSGSGTRGKLGTYDLGGFVLEIFEDDPAVLNFTNLSSRDLTRASSPWVNQKAFDKWAAAAGVPWDDAVDDHWIDLQTRAVIIDVAMYNPSLRILTVVRLLVEISETGRVIPTYAVYNMRQRPFFDATDFESWSEWGFLLVIGLLTIRNLAEGARDARTVADQMLQKSFDTIGLLTGQNNTQEVKPGRVKSGATVVPADAPALHNLKKRDKNANDKPNQVDRTRASPEANTSRQASDDPIKQEIEAHRLLEIRQRLLGELHANRLWRVIDLINYALFLVPLTMEGIARMMLHDTFKEVVASDAAQRANLVSVQKLLDAENSTLIVDHTNVSHLDHISFYLPGYLSRMATTLLALNAVPTWAKMVNHLRAFPHFGVVALTLQHAYYETLCFLVLFFNVFVGWGMAFSATFGNSMVQYSTVSNSMMSLFRLLLGDYEFDDMYDAQGMIACVLFVIYYVLVSFLLANMFVAMMSNSYLVSKVRVMGDITAEHNKSKWEGVESFLEYVWNRLTDHRPCYACKPSVKRGKVEQTEENQPAFNTDLIWVGGIPEGATQAGVTRLLSRFGHPRVHLHKTEGKRNSWAVVKYSTQDEARTCTEAGIRSGSSATGLVLPAIEANEGVDVKLRVERFSISKMAKLLVSNPNGALADMWFNLRLDAVSEERIWSPYEQTTIINATLRVEERKMFELLEATRAVDALLHGPQKRKLDRALDLLTEEGQYMLLSVHPKGVRARRRFKEAKLAVKWMGDYRSRGYRARPEIRQALVKLATARALGLTTPIDRSREP